MFEVFDNGKPASVEGFPNLLTWKTNRFETLLEAHNYAKNWLGAYYHEGLALLPGVSYDYSGYQDLIEIRETAQ